MFPAQEDLRIEHSWGVSGEQYARYGLLIKMLVNPSLAQRYSCPTLFSRTSDCWLDRMDRHETQLKPVLQATYGEKWQRW